MFDKQFEKQWNNFLKKKAIEELELNPCPTSVFLTRFEYKNWLKTREEIWQESDANSFEAFVKQLTHVFKQLKPFCPGIGRGAGNFFIARDCLLKEFKLSLRLGSRSDFFTSQKQECERTIDQSGALIRIKAPRKMGKSKLLSNILNYANEQQYGAVHINLLQIESSRFNSLDLFLRWFCIYISDALDLDLELDNYWSENRGSMLSCTRYIEIILEQLEQPLVLGLDEVDRLLNYPDISQDFFYLLRSWHEEANNNELWEKLRLVVVYSTEDFGNLDINQSPFNVGFPVELKPIDRPQLVELAHSYSLDLKEMELDRLMTMLGGHPYLVDLILSNLSGNSKLGLEELLQQAVTDTGIYSSYLRRHLINLKSNTRLTAILLEILDNPKPVRVDTLLGYQLYRMGLIKWSQNNSVVPSCELFRLYFLPRLKGSS